MFQQQYLFWLAGVILLIVGVMSWRDKANPRRLTTGLFWALYGLVFLVGDWTYSLMSQFAGSDAEGQRSLHIVVGVLVVVMALVAGLGGVKLGSYHQRTEEQRKESATRLGNKLFLPALSIPVVTVVGVLAFNNIPALQQAVFGAGNHSTLITLFSMTVGCLVGWLVALKLTREAPAQSLQETRRLLDSIAGHLFCRKSSPPSACCLPPPVSVSLFRI